MSSDRYASVPERITWTTGFRLPVDKAVLGTLSTFANFRTGKHADMALPTLVDRAQMSRSTVLRALERLIADEWVFARRRHRRPTVYDINVDKLATHWMEAEVVAGLSVTGDTQEKSLGVTGEQLSVTGDTQTPVLSVTGDTPSPVRTDPLLDPQYLALRADPSTPQQLAFSPMAIPSAPAPASGDVWAAVLARVEQQVNRHTFYTYWKDSVLVEDRGGVIIVRTKNEREQHELVADWISRHFTGVLADALAVVRPGAVVVFAFAVRQPREDQRRSG